MARVAALCGIIAALASFSIAAPARAQDAQSVLRWEALALAGVEAINQDQMPRALDRFQQALGVAAQFAPNDQRRINSLLNIATAHRRLREYEQAQFYFLEAIRLQEAAGDADLVMTLDGLGMMYLEQGLAGPAEPMLRRAVELLQALAGEDHPFTALVVEHLADTIIALGRYDEAAEMLGHIVQVRAKNFGDGHRSLAPPLTRQGMAYMAASRNLDAAECLRRALVIWQNTPDAPPVEMQLTLGGLVDISEVLGRVRDAAEYQRNLVAALERDGVRGRALSEEFSRFARLLRRAGEAGAAEQADRDAMRARDAVFP